MSTDVKRVFEEALRLSVQARARLAATLIDSLEDADERDVDEAWAAELERRGQELEEGSVAGVPWTEARQRILEP